MISVIQNILPYAVLLSHIVFVLLILAITFRKSWGRGAVKFVRNHSIALGLLISIAAIAGSLFYSLGIGYTPCELCWWQRILLYPQVILFLTALKPKDRDVFKYSWRLAVLAAAVSLYQIWAQSGGTSLLGCTSIGGECMKIYVNAFGYITIPVMSLTISLYFLLLAYINRAHDE